MARIESGREMWFPDAYIVTERRLLGEGYALLQLCENITGAYKLLVGGKWTINP